MDKTMSREMSLRIKLRRKELGFTQERMSEKLGLSASSYTKIENSFQTPSLDTLIKISSELNLSLDYIVFGNESNKNPLNIDDVLSTILKNIDIEQLKYTNELIGDIVRLRKTF